MIAKYIQTGDIIDYTPTSDVSAGAVVVQDQLVGVANNDIKANKLGALAVAGVFEFPKDGSAIVVGAKCYWDTTNQQATTTESGNTYLGKCIKAAIASDTTVRVRLSQ